MFEAERVMLVAPVLISVTWLQDQITDTNNWVRPLRYIPSLVFRQRSYCCTVSSHSFALFPLSSFPTLFPLSHFYPILAPLPLPRFLSLAPAREEERGKRDMRRGEETETNNAKPLCPTNQSCLPCPVCWSVALQFFQSIGNGKQTAGPRRSDWQAGYELGSPVSWGFMTDFCTGGWDCLPICTQHSNQ